MQNIKDQIELVENIKLYGKLNTLYYWVQPQLNDNSINALFSDEAIVEYNEMLFKAHGMIISEDEIASIALYSGESLDIDLSNGYLLIDAEKVDEDAANSGIIHIQYKSYPEWFRYKYIEASNFPRYTIKTETVVTPDGELKYAAQIIGVINLLTYSDLVFYITEYYCTPSEALIDAANMMNKFNRNTSMEDLGFISNPIIIDKNAAQLYSVNSLSKYGVSVSTISDHEKTSINNLANIIPYSSLYGTDDFLLFSKDKINYIIYDENGNPVKYNFTESMSNDTIEAYIPLLSEVKDILSKPNIQHIIQIYISDLNIFDFAQYIKDMDESGIKSAYNDLLNVDDILTRFGCDNKSGLIFKQGINITIVDSELLLNVRDILQVLTPENEKEDEEVME